MNLVSINNVEEISVDDLKGEKIVLFFYPKANTPGWVVEANDFSGLKNEYNKLGYRVIGISRDSVKLQQKFIETRNLTVEIISDSDEELCKHFDVIKEKKMFGKIGFGIERSTFVLDEDFNIIKEYRKVCVKGHAEEVLDDLKK